MRALLAVSVEPTDEPFTGRFQTDFIAARRIALEIFLHKTANHPMLASDPDLKLFLESDTFTLEVRPSMLLCPARVLKLFATDQAPEA